MVGREQLKLHHFPTANDCVHVVSQVLQLTSKWKLHVKVLANVKRIVQKKSEERVAEVFFPPFILLCFDLKPVVSFPSSLGIR